MIIKKIKKAKNAVPFVTNFGIMIILEDSYPDED